MERMCLVNSYEKHPATSVDGVKTGLKLESSYSVWNDQMSAIWVWFCKNTNVNISLNYWVLKADFLLELENMQRNRNLKLKKL